MADISSLTKEQKLTLIEMLRANIGDQKKQRDYERNLGEERQKMMDERSGLDNALAGIGKAAVDAGSGFAQIFGFGPSAEQVDETRRLEGMLMESGGGITGNLAGQTALSMAPMGAGRLMAAVPGRVGRFAQALPGSNTVAGGVGTGAMIGAVEPVGTKDSRLGNMAFAGVAGGAIPAVLQTGKIAKAALVDPFTKGGHDEMAIRIFLKDKSPQEVAAFIKSLKDAPEFIPGSKPTVAQASLDPNASAIEAAMANEAGPMKAALSQRLMEQHQARANFMAKLAGTPEDIEAIQDVAGKAFRSGTQVLKGVDADIPTGRTVQLIDRILNSGEGENMKVAKTLASLREQFFVPYKPSERLSDAAKQFRDAVNGSWYGKVGKEERRRLDETARALVSANRAAIQAERFGEPSSQHVLAAMKAIDEARRGVTTKGGNQAVSDAYDLLFASNQRLKTDPDKLIGIHRQINTLKRELKKDGADTPSLRALDAVGRSLRNAIDKATKDLLPADAKTFSQINKLYAQAKGKENALETLQYIRDKSSGTPRPTPDGLSEVSPLKPDTFLRLTSGANQKATVRAATGQKRPGKFSQALEPRQLADLNKMRMELMRANAAARPIEERGSPTAKNLITANFIEQAAGGMGLPNAWAPSFTNFMMGAPVVGRALNFLTDAADQPVKANLARLAMNAKELASLVEARAKFQNGPAFQINSGVMRLLPPGLAAMASGGMFAPRQLPQEEPPYGARW